MSGRREKQHPRPTEAGVGGRLRVRHRVHGNRPRRPDPAGHLERPARHRDRDRAALHELSADHGPRHAHHELHLESHRPQAHPHDRPRAHRHLRAGGGARPERAGSHRVPGRVGARQCPLHLDGARHDRRCRERRNERGDHPLRSGAGSGHRGGAVARRAAGFRQLAGPVLRHGDPPWPSGSSPSRCS